MEKEITPLEFILTKFDKNDRDLRARLQQSAELCKEVSLDAKGHELSHIFTEKPDEYCFFLFAVDPETKGLVGSMMLSTYDVLAREYRDKYSSEPSIHIEATIVDSKNRHKGTSPRMFAYLHEHAKGISRITSEIWDANTASIASRTKMGFERIESNIYSPEKEGKEGEPYGVFIKYVDPEIAKKPLPFNVPKKSMFQIAWSQGAKKEK